MANHVYLAVDLGASSGRVVAGLFQGRTLTLEEVHRFENGAVEVCGTLHWDVLGLWKQVLEGMRLARQKYGDLVRSIGVDSWGVDFGLLGRDDVLLGNPVTYRDRRTEGMMEQAIAELGREEIFAHTGLQFMTINTLYQMMALRRRNSPWLEGAKTFLMMADLFHWLLTGVKTNEVTNATTTQFFNPVRRTWATELLEKLDLPTDVFPKLVEPGTKLGKLRPVVAAETGFANLDVVVPGTHDTASAVLAVPARMSPDAGEQPPHRGSLPGVPGRGSQGRPDWCYISSGTWALIGIETPAPVMTDLCRELTFTNEGGVGNTIRVLKNITGLWLVQECRRIWLQQAAEGTAARYEWTALARASAEARPHVAFIDPDDASFTAPENMPEAIRAFCRRTGQTVPEGDGAIFRTAIESLALKCRTMLGKLEQLNGGPIRTIHIVGGGTRNRELCQATADACGRPAIAGPVEATAVGNVMMQAIAAGTVADIAEARRIVGESFAVERYEPRDSDAWDRAYERFVKLLPG